jgi:hypothetical protein
MRFKRLNEEDNEVATLLPDIHFNIATNSQLKSAVHDFWNSGNSLCTVTILESADSINADFEIRQNVFIPPSRYFYGVLRKGTKSDFMVLNRLKKFLYENEPELLPIKSEHIRWRRFFSEHCMKESENEYLIVIRKPDRMLLHTQFFIRSLLEYPACKIMFIENEKSGL